MLIEPEQLSFFWVELVSANRTKPPANAELCLLYIVQRFTLKRAII